MKRLLVAALVVLGISAPGALAAVNPDEMLDNPKLEARARQLEKHLRCLVCQNQSIDDSNADLARDLRKIVREQIAAGKSDQQVIAFLTDRYGDFILLKPPVKPSTWGLWFGPAGVLVIAGVGVVVYVRRRRSQAESAPPLSEEEQARLDAMLGDEPGAR